MIVGLRGRIESLEHNQLVLETNGVLYGIYVSLLCALDLKKEMEVRLFISEIIREDAYLLFGFTQKIEQEIFERLIKISGVGPKVAMAILSTFSPQDFAQIVESKNIGALQKVPGIGAKGASKIMLDLAGFFDFSRKDKNQEALSQASLALENLGFKRSEIDKVFKKIKAQNTSEIIKEALKLFSIN